MSIAATAAPRFPLSIRRGLTLAWPIEPILAALLFTAGLLVIFDATSLDAFGAMAEDAAGDSAMTLVMILWITFIMRPPAKLLVF